MFPTVKLIQTPCIKTLIKLNNIINIVSTGIVILETLNKLSKNKKK